MTILELNSKVITYVDSNRNDNLDKNKIILTKTYSDLLDSSKKEPRWNFWKYLVNPEGQVVKFWRPEEPIDVIRPEIAALIRQMILKKKEDL